MVKKKTVSLLLTTVMAGLLMSTSAGACTNLRLVAGDGGVVVGRTMEFGADMKSNVLVIPAGTELTSSLADKSQGMQYTTKYGMTGGNAYNLTIIADGINDQGLYVGAHLFPGYASYPDLDPKNASQNLAPEDYVVWLLASCANVEEVKANYNKAILVNHPLKELEGGTYTAHFIVHDSTGASVVIEPVNKELKIYDNPIGVLTNSPPFDWHITNLSNYVNLQVNNVPPVELSGLKITNYGQGSGMHGLPGDFTPPSRFIRAVVFSETAVKLPTTEKTVLQVFHIMNMFDIPVGAVEEIAGSKAEPDYTQYTSASDLKHLTWSFKTYDNQSIRSVDVRKACSAAGNEIKTIVMHSEQPIEDVSTKFK